MARSPRRGSAFAAAEASNTLKRNEFVPPSSDLSWWTDLGVDPPVHDVVEDVSLEKFAGCVVVLARKRDYARQPVLMSRHPSRFPAENEGLPFGVLRG